MLLCSVEPLVFNALVRLLIDVAAELLLVVTVLFNVVMFDCRVEPLVFRALVKLFRDVAADELFVVTVWLKLVILL